MIRYALRCKKGHEFEAWFKSSSAFDEQSKGGKVICAVCGSKKVEKALMAPRVSTRGKREMVPVAAAPEAGPPDETRQKMISLLRKLRSEVERNAEYVGPQFADEARKIHYEEAPARGIYGEASPDDVKQLKEEGIEFYPLPQLPEDHN
jgi:hypothetical protein